MSTKTTKFTNKAGEVAGTVAYDEATKSSRLIFEAEPEFQRTVPREQAAFYFWYSKFDSHAGAQQKS